MSDRGRDVFCYAHLRVSGAWQARFAIFALMKEAGVAGFRGVLAFQGCFGRILHHHPVVISYSCSSFNLVQKARLPMKNPRRRRLIVILIVMSVVSILIFLQEREPIYEDKSLSRWMKDYMLSELAGV